MCWPRVGEANPLFSVYIALWRSTALAIIYNVVGRQRNLGLWIMISLSLASQVAHALNKPTIMQTIYKSIGKIELTWTIPLLSILDQTEFTFNLSQYGNNLNKACFILHQISFIYFYGIAKNFQIVSSLVCLSDMSTLTRNSFSFALDSTCLLLNVY